VAEPTLIKRRVEDLKAVMLEQHDPDGPDWKKTLYVSVLCDGCGKVKELPAYLPEVWERMLSGWVLSEMRPYEDYCPRCA